MIRFFKIHKEQQILYPFRSERMERNIFSYQTKRLEKFWKTIAVNALFSSNK